MNKAKSKKGTRLMFPISVKFEDGAIETYNDVEELMTNLEDFDSDIDTACEVRDNLGSQ